MILQTFTTGFDSSFAIGNVHRFSQDLFEDFIVEKIPAIEWLFNETMIKILSNKELEMVNWSEILVAQSKKYSHVVNSYAIRILKAIRSCKFHPDCY